MAAYPHHASLPPTDSISVTYSENEEEEVDQLDSDFDEEIPIGGASSSKAKRSRRRSGERLPGQTLLPSSKLESIMHSDGATPTANHLSREAVFMLSIATEEFIKKLAEAGYRESMAEQRNEVCYNDLAAATQQYQEFMFLQDTIPQPLSVVEAFERRAAQEKALLADDPAISSSSTYVPSFVTPSGLALTNAQKGKGKGKLAPNGKTKTNGSTSTAKRQRDKNGRYSNDDDDDDMDFDNGIRVAAPSMSRRNSRTGPGEEMHVNGFQQGTQASWPVSQQPSDTEVTPTVEGQWAPQQYLGPASGFIQDHRLPFGNDNPGRTIYSQR